MKCRLTRFCSLLLVLFSLGGCASLPDIIPQIPLPRADNHSLPAGQDIEQANAFLDAGKKRDAASAYFAASANYRSPQRERLILQAAELAAIIKDSALTQRYLASLNYPSLNKENQARFRFTQAQLALNDRNYRETLRILPQRVNGLPQDLGKKILNARMSAAQSSGDKLALVQELVLQEPGLQQEHERKLNHDRIWNHIQQMPGFQLDKARKSINHAVLKNWLELGYLVKKSGTNREILRNNLTIWQQRNPNHPGNIKASQLSEAAPATKVTPYQDGITKGGIKPAKTEQIKTDHTKKQIAILLPLTGRLSSIGNTLLKGIQQAHSERPNNSELKIYNTASSSIDGVYQSAIRKGADFVIGPFIKPAISSLSKSNIPVPTLALNYVDNTNNSSANLYQFGLSPEDEAVQVAQYVLNQNRKRVALLTPDSSWGRRLQEAMRRAVIERRGKVTIMESYRDNAISYQQPAKSIAARANEIDAILIAASPTQVRRLYPDLRQQVPSLPIYATSHVFNGLANIDKDSVLEGLLFTETPWVLDTLQQSKHTSDFPRLFAMGMDAYIISSGIDKLKNFGSTLNGRTGKIRLSKDGSLHRSLRWARFSKGSVIPHGS